MIIERLTFHTKYGQGDALLALLRESGSFLPSTQPRQRAYTDVTGPMFTVWWDFEYESLEALTAGRAEYEKMYQDPQFQEWFAKMQPLVERGERQILQVVDL